MTVSIDYTLLIQIINFLVLIFVLNYILYRPIRNVLSKRKEKIDGLEQNIELSIQGAKEKEDEFSEGLKDARSRGQNEKESLLGDAVAEEKKISGQINEKAQAELLEVKEKIKNDAEEVRNSLLKEIDEFANEIGRKILGRAV